MKNGGKRLIMTHAVWRLHERIMSVREKLKTKKRALRNHSGAPFINLKSIIMKTSISQFGLDELAVQAGNVADSLALGAYSLAGAGIGTVTEAQFVHLGYHVLGTAGSLYLTLGKQGKLANL